MERRCALRRCGKSFEPSDPRQKYCSPRCRRYVSNSRYMGRPITGGLAVPVYAHPAENDIPEWS